MDNNKDRLLQTIMPYVALGVIALIILWYIKNQIGSATDSLGITQSSEDKQANRDAVTSIPVNISKLSYPSLTYLTMANNAYNAMHGIGTDASTLLATFRLFKNQDDYNFFLRNFGVRDGWNFFTWIRDEMPTSSTAIMGRYLRDNIEEFNSILKSKKITQNLL